jgi:hypothetical protein
MFKHSTSQSGTNTSQETLSTQNTRAQQVPTAKANDRSDGYIHFSIPRPTFGTLMMILFHLVTYITLAAMAAILAEDFISGLVLNFLASVLVEHFIYGYLGGGSVEAHVEIHVGLKFAAANLALLWLCIAAVVRVCVEVDVMGCLVMRGGGGMG